MRIYADLSGQKPETVVEHNGHELRFCARVFQRDAFQQEGIDVFEPLNSYWQTSGIDDDNLFKIFIEVERGFDQIHSNSEMFSHLNMCIKNIVEITPIDHICSWVARDTGFIIPPEIMEVFVADEERKNSADKTYLKPDYFELISLSMLMRTLMPIFGEYIESTRREVGINFKEFHGIQLLTDTGVLESRPVRKLLDYIGQITKGNDQNGQLKGKYQNSEAILKGSSSLDMDFYLLSQVMVRKLSICDIRGLGPKPNLISQVYNFIFPKVFNPPKTQMPIRDKGMIAGRNEGDDGGGGRSFLEAYKKRTALSLANVAGIELGYENIYTNGQRLCSGITKHEIDQCIETSKMLANERIGTVQTVLLSWVMKSIHSPRSPGYVDKNQFLIPNLGLLEAVLWKWGFEYLSILSTSHMIIGQEVMHVSPIDSRAQIPMRLQHEITELYPYIWSNTGKTITKQEPHPVLYAIDLFVDDLINSAWRATASKEKLNKVFGEPRRKLPIIPTIKTELAKLIIFIEKNGKEKPVSKMQQF